MRHWQKQWTSPHTRALWTREEESMRLADDRVMVRVEHDWRDWWVGVYWNRTPRIRPAVLHLYICIIPTFPLHILWQR